jgi:hypothetical protein
MKNNLKCIVMMGGIFNSILALFHIYLALMIFKFYSGMNFYPLMQTLNICGSLMIFFFAYTSIRYPNELINSKAGRSILVLNVLLYTGRFVCEFVLFPAPKILIVFTCSLIAGIYLFVIYSSRKIVS